MNGPQALLEVASLRISVRTDEGVARILDHVDLRVDPGSVVGIVGESGCGKSTLVRAILGILPRAARVENGSIRFNGRDLLGMPAGELQSRIRGRAIGFVPQDPYLALNPMFRVGAQLMEILRWHGAPGDDPGASRSERKRRHRALLVELLRRVQIPDPDQALDRYPHEFSGGQRQRLLIAGALACGPQLVVADEPTTALDVTTQLQILKLLRALVDERGLALLFVSHDIGAVAQLCDRVSVMYAGQSVESGLTRDVLDQPGHPYSSALIACHPDRSEGFRGIPGAVPSPLRPPSGCRFAPRCGSSSARCSEARPPSVRIAADHTVNCVLQEAAGRV